MPAKKRIKTQYPGVYYIESSFTGLGQLERIYYIMYRLDGRLVEEKVGRQYQDDMTAARAAYMRDLRKKGKQLPNRIRRERKNEGERVSSGQTIDRIWEEYKARNPNVRGLRFDENRYQNYLRRRFGSKKPEDILQPDIDRLRTDLLKQKKPQTVKHILALLRRIINFGVKEKICAKLNFIIRMPKIDNRKTEILTPDEIERLLNAVDADRNPQVANIMKLSLFTGMKRGELFRLKWSDIDFSEGSITIRDADGKPGQKIPLNDRARQILTTHPKHDSPFVFPGRGGKQRVDINKQVNRIKNHAGLPKDFRPLHGLRNVYAAIHALSSQTDTDILQRIVTQKNPHMNRRYFAHLDSGPDKASSLTCSIIEQMINSELL